MECRVGYDSGVISPRERREHAVRRVGNHAVQRVVDREDEIRSWVVVHRWC